MKYLLIFLIVFNYSCSKDKDKESNPTPTNPTGTINNYTMTIQQIGGIASYHEIKLNGSTINHTTSISVKTNDKITGTSNYSGSVASNVGIVIYLNGVEKYRKEATISNTSTLNHNYTVN